MTNEEENKIHRWLGDNEVSSLFGLTAEDAALCVQKIADLEGSQETIRIVGGAGDAPFMVQISGSRHGIAHGKPLSNAIFAAVLDYLKGGY